MHPAHGWGLWEKRIGRLVLCTLGYRVHKAGCSVHPVDGWGLWGRGHRNLMHSSGATRAFSGPPEGHSHAAPHGMPQHLCARTHTSLPRGAITRHALIASAPPGSTGPLTRDT